MSAPESRPNDVAIVGMTARLPGAEDLDQLWRNLEGGVESVSFLSPEKPVVRRGLAHVKAVPQIAGMELFDAGFFGFSPGEAETMDPQIRLFLECAWHALESAGCDPAQTPGRIGVFAGCGLSTYLTGHLLPNREVMRSARSGLSSLGQFNDRDALATIVSYKLDLTGPAVTVQTFCSTSLVAVHLACQSLLSGESDLALAGGAAVNPALSTGYVYQEGGILSPDGHTRSFDAQAGGTVFGNGVGAVVLKRLDDALAEGDVVHAVIRGSAINNDGGGKAGYTAPSVVGQSKAIAEALAVAQVSPDAVSYVEAHGTATAIGDPIEIEALTRAFRTGTARKGFCAVGSVKTNFGHLDRAAGVAALIKTVLALEHQKLPPSLHFERPNPKIDFDTSPFVVNTTLREWPANGKPRVAGVNSLGVGGTNAHAIVEEAPVRPPSGPSRAAQLLVVSARTETALEAATERLAGLLRSSSAPPLPDLAFTLLAGRHRFEHRRFVVASTAAEAAERLGGGASTPPWSGYSRASERPVVFLFPGQGAQYPGMTRGLYDSEKAFKADVEACLDVLGALGVELRRALFPAPTEAAEAADRLRQTALAQPALFIVEYALARQLGRLGIEPQAMVGHSIGEYVAAHLARVMSLEDALLLVAERGRLMQSLPPGSMLAVSLSESELLPMLDGNLALAAVNAPRLSVVSGPTPEIEALEQRLQSMEAFTARLHTSHAFHSSMMEPILEEFEQRLARVALRAPQIPYVSNRTGTWIEDEQAQSPRYWAEHLRHTVRFAPAVATLWEDPSRILLEVGPGNALTNLAKQQPPPEGEPAVASTVRHPRESRSDLEVLLAAVGRLWGEGARVLGQSVYAGEDRHRVELPLYPFERKRLWIDPPQPGTRAADRLETARRPLSEWVYVPTWSSAPPPLLAAHSGAKPALGDWLLFVDEEGIGAALATRLRERGRSVITVAAGERFGGTPTEGYQLDPTARADYDRLLEDLSTTGRPVSRVVYGWGAGEVVAPDRLYYGLFYLAQALAARGSSAPLQLKVLTTHLHDVMRGDVIQPAKAPLLGLAKVIPQEQHDLTCASVDVEPAGSTAWQDDSALELLLEELSADAPGVVAAHRRGQRWTQGFERLDLPAPADPPLRLRERGVYLITGGLGGVTFVLAAHLAQKVKARLVLTGRSALPRPEQWDAWLADHGPADPVCLRIGRVRKLQELGAEVLVVRADAGDLDQMRAAVADAESRFGAIHGVIHGAGVVGGDTFRPLTQIGRTEIEAQFHAKVKGLEVLEQALEGRDVDFCMLTSSLSSVLGGFGYGAYAAANLYMDAFARARAGSGRWISVNWDEWRLSGPVDEPAAGSGLARFAMAPAEGAAVFARILEARGLSQVVVSSGDLAVRREQWIRLVGLRTKPTEGEKKEKARRHPRPNLHNPYVAASTATEKQVAAIWQELLGMEKVGIHDNFFELGGHSLMAIQLVTEIRTRMDAEISVATLFEGPTVHSLSRLVEPEAAEPAVVDQSRERGERRKAESRRRQALREQSLP